MCGRGGEAHGPAHGRIGKFLNENFSQQKNAAQTGGGDGLLLSLLRHVQRVRFKLERLNTELFIDAKEALLNRCNFILVKHSSGFDGVAQAASILRNDAHQNRRHTMYRHHVFSRHTFNV